MQQIADFNPGDNTTYPASQTYFLPGNPGMLAIINDSPYTLGFQFNEGTVRTCPAGMCRAWPTTQSMKSLTFAVTQAPAAAGQAQISQCVIEYYYENEPTYEQFPAALTRLITIGNNVPVGTAASSVQNDGNVAGTQVLEAKASGLTASATLIDNQGTLIDKVISNGAQVTALDIEPGGASTPATILFHGTADVATAANGLESGPASTSDLTYLAVGANDAVLVTPQPPGVAQALFARTWDGTAFHNTELANQFGGMPLSSLLAGALPAGITVPGAQVTGDIAANQVGPGALDTDVTLGAPQLTAGAIPTGVTLPAGQLTAGVVPAGITLAGAQVTGDIAANQLGPGAIDADVVVSSVNNLDGSKLPIAGGKFIIGFQQLSVNSSGTYSHGIGATPDGVLVNADNGTNSTTTGSGTYGSSSVFVYIFSAMTCCVLVYKAG